MVMVLACRAVSVMVMVLACRAESVMVMVVACRAESVMVMVLACRAVSVSLRWGKSCRRAGEVAGAAGCEQSRGL